MRFTSIQKITKKDKITTFLKSIKKYILPIIWLLLMSIYLVSVISNSWVWILNKFYEKDITKIEINKKTIEEINSRKEITSYNKLFWITISWTNEAFNIANWLHKKTDWNKLIKNDVKDLFKIKRESTFNWIMLNNTKFSYILSKKYGIVLKNEENSKRTAWFEENYVYHKTWKLTDLLSNKKDFEWVYFDYSAISASKLLNFKLKWKLISVIVTEEELNKLFFNNEYKYINWISILIWNDESINDIKDKITRFNRILSIQNSNELEITLLSSINKWIFKFIWDSKIKNAFIWFKK